MKFVKVLFTDALSESKSPQVDNFLGCEPVSSGSIDARMYPSVCHLSTTFHSNPPFKRFSLSGGNFKKSCSSDAKV